MQLSGYHLPFCLLSFASPNQEKPEGKWFLTLYEINNPKLAEDPYERLKLELAFKHLIYNNSYVSFTPDSIVFYNANITGPGEFRTYYWQTDETIYCISIEGDTLKNYIRMVDAENLIMEAESSVDLRHYRKAD